MTGNPSANILNRFMTAGGSVAGTAHTRPMMLGSSNNQDAMWVRWLPDMLVGVVCDGVGSGKLSEFGAVLGVRLIANAIVSQYRSRPDAFPNWAVLSETIAERLRDQLRLLVGEADPAYESLETGGGTKQYKVIIDNLLFTALGFVMTRDRSWIFGLGDGVWALNGEVVVIPPFPDNAPPCLGYRLLADDPEPYTLRAFAAIPTNEVSSLLIGTDGVADLIAEAGHTLPGEGESIGPLEQFWSPAAIKDPMWIQQRLDLINRHQVSADWETRRIRHDVGRLPDDTTIIAVRRAD